MTKVIKTKVIKKEVKEVVKKDKRIELKSLLLKEMPALFDRTPEITGNINSLVDKIISLF